MVEIPFRKAVKLDENMVAVLECGHDSYHVEYADRDVPCILCTKNCGDNIADIRGRTVVKCQRRMSENVWDRVGSHFRNTPASEVRWAVSNEIEGDGIPF